MGVRAPTPPPLTMAREPALCTLPPRHVSRSNIAAVTARRLLMRTCSSPPLPEQAVAVGLRCGTANPQNTFSDHEVALGSWCGKTNIKPSRSFARLDPVFARDSSGRSVFFFRLGGFDKIGYLVSLLEQASRKRASLDKTFIATCPSPAPIDAHRVYGPCFGF